MGLEYRATRGWQRGDRDLEIDKVMQHFAESESPCKSKRDPVYALAIGR